MNTKIHCYFSTFDSLFPAMKAFKEKAFDEGYRKSTEMPKGYLYFALRDNYFLGILMENANSLHDSQFVIVSGELV